MYFNAGTEKYLQGNFTESIENLEKAQALDPSNKKIKEFMVKISAGSGDSEPYDQELPPGFHIHRKGVKR